MPHSTDKLHVNQDLLSEGSNWVCVSTPCVAQEVPNTIIWLSAIVRQERY